MRSVESKNKLLQLNHLLKEVKSTISILQVSNCRSLSKWFYDIFTEPATGAVRCGSLFRKRFGLLVVSSRWTRST
jgi:hypothetical protein